MFLMTRSLTLACLAAALAAPSAFAQQTQTQTTTTPRTAANAGQQPQTAGQAPVSDALFASAAASGGLAEVTLAELGVQKATDPELKRFSQRMVDEHTRMNSELTTLASQKQIPLPRTPDARATFCAQSLAGLSGQEFDKCYAKAQLMIHMDSAAAFQAESERGQDPQVKALAAKSLPHIKDHLKTIKPIAMKYMDKDDNDGGHGQAQEKSSTGTSSR